MDRLLAGVDLGGTKVSCVLATEAGRVLRQSVEPTLAHEGPDAVIARIVSQIQKLCASEGANPQAVGIGVPGLADVVSGTTRFLPNLPTQWRDVPVALRMKPALGCDVFLINDARAATLGELTYGHGRDVQSMLFFTLGTGVGGGVVIDRKLRLGPLGAAGELGHQTILPEGPRCGCGNRGCLETLVSGPALAAAAIRLVRSGLAPKLHGIAGGDDRRITPQTMLQAAVAGDTHIAEVIREAAEYLGVGVANMIVALHPELVVFGGGVAEMGPTLIDAVRVAACARVGMMPTDSIRFERSLLGEQAGVLGAVALAARGGLVS